MNLATDMLKTGPNFLFLMVLQQEEVEVEGANWVEEGLKVAATEAKEVEMEAMEVALQAEAVARMIWAVVQPAKKTFDQNAALELLVFVQAESQRQV